MKKINECTDGRGCEKTNRCRLSPDTMRITSNGCVLGCVKYYEKPAEHTLKERIDKFYHEFTGHGFAEANKALLRDIVDYAWKDGAVCDLDATRTIGMLYKELGIGDTHDFDECHKSDREKGYV